MGKSALAVRICRYLENAYGVVGWLSATDPASWRSSVALLAERLGLSGTDPDDLWRALGGRRPALIVLDDAVGPGGFASALPWTPGLHLLITSQSVRWRSAADVIELEPLDEHDGVEYLLARTGAKDERLTAAVTHRLGGFPLALEQAAAAIVDGLSLRGRFRIAFNADPAVQLAADTTISNPYLDSVLFILGIHRSEVENADAEDSDNR